MNKRAKRRRKMLKAAGTAPNWLRTAAITRSNRVRKGRLGKLGPASEVRTVMKDGVLVEAAE